MSDAPCMDGVIPTTSSVVWITWGLNLFALEFYFLEKEILILKVDRIVKFYRRNNNFEKNLME